MVGFVLVENINKIDMQIETTISTLYNVKKCLEERLKEFSISREYTSYQIKMMEVKEQHKKAAEMYIVIFDKLRNIENNITEAINKL